MKKINFCQFKNVNRKIKLFLQNLLYNLLNRQQIIESANESG